MPDAWMNINGAALMLHGRNPFCANCDIPATGCG
jgi:hypothetical protein